MNFSEHLTMLRKQKGLSQEALAEKLGVSRQAVSKWERGEAQPELSKLLAMCELFSVTANELLGFEENREEAVDSKGKNNKQRALFWMVVGCMGFIVAAFCMIWAIAHPHIYNGQDGLYGSLLGNDCMFPFVLGTVVMLAGLLEAYFEISKKGSSLDLVKKKLHRLMKDGNATK